MYRVWIALLIAGTSTVASAETYLGAGLGTEASVGGGMTGFQGNGGRSERLMLGERISWVSIEASGTRFGLRGSENAPFTGTELAAALKLSVPLGYNFALFGRGGFQRSWLTTDSSQPERSG